MIKGPGIVKHDHEGAFSVRVGIGPQHTPEELEKFVLDSLIADGWEVSSIRLDATMETTLRSKPYDHEAAKEAADNASHAHAGTGAFAPGNVGFFHDED